VEGGDAVAWLELEDVGSDLLHDACYVVALVGGTAEEIGQFPVLGVGSRDNDFDEDLVIVGDRDGRVHDLDLGSWVVVRGVGYSDEGKGVMPLLTRASFMALVVQFRNSQYWEPFS
jgi:hypothetical protein